MPKRKAKRNINLVKVNIVPPSEPASNNANSKLTAAAKSAKPVTSVDVNVVETHETPETSINSAKCKEKEANSPSVKETESMIMKTSILEDKKSSEIDKSLENISQDSQLELNNIVSSQNLSKNSENAEVTKKNIPKHFANLRKELLFLNKYNYKYYHKSKISQQKSINNAVLRTPRKTRTFLRKDADCDKINVKFTSPEVNSEPINIKSESTKYISGTTKPDTTKVKSELIEVKSESIKVKPESAKVKSSSKALTLSSISTQQSQAISKTSNADSIKSSNVSEKCKTAINVKQVPHQVGNKHVATVENLRKSLGLKTNDKFVSIQKSSKKFEETRIVTMKPTIGSSCSSSKRNLSSKRDHKLYTDERVVKKKETGAYKRDNKNKQYAGFKDNFYWEKDTARSKSDYKHQKLRSSRTEKEYIHGRKNPYTWINDSKKEIHRKEVDVEEMQIDENYFEEVEVASDEELSKSSEILIGFRKYKKFYLHSLNSSYFKPKIFYISPERTVVNCVEKISRAEELDEISEMEGSDKDAVCVDEVIIIDCPVSVNNDVNSSNQSTNFKEDSGIKDTLEVLTEANSNTSLTEKSCDPPEKDTIKNIADSSIELETNTALDDEESGNEVEIIEVDDDEIFDEIEECLSDTAEDKSPEESVLQTTAEDKSPEENVLQTITKLKSPEVEVIDIDENSESGIVNSDEVVCSQSIDKLISTVQILREKEKVATAIKVPRKYLEFRSKLHLEIGKFYQGPSVYQDAIDAWNSHLIGLEYILEVRDNLKAVVAEKFICTLCCITLDKNICSQVLIDHITGYSHMFKYMEKHFPSCGSKISEHVSLYNRNYLMIECYEAINEKLGYQYLCYTDKICLELYGDDIYKNIASIKHFDESEIQLNMDKYVKSLSDAILLDVQSTINHIVKEIEPSSETIIILDDDNLDDVSKKVDKIKKVNRVSLPIKASVSPISTLNTFTIPVAHRESRDGAFQLLKKTSLSFSNTRTSTRSNLVQIPVQETLNSNTKPTSVTVLMQSIATGKANNAKQILGADQTKPVIKKNVQPIKKISKKNISGAQSHPTVKSQSLTKDTSDQDIRLVRMVTKKCGNFSVQVDNECDSEDISALHEEISDTDLLPEDVLPVPDVQQKTKNICIDDSSQDIRSVSNLDNSLDNSVLADDNSMGRTAHKRKPEKTTLHSKHCIKRILGRNKSIKGLSESIDEETSSSYRQRSPASSETSSKYRRLSRSPVHHKITSPLRIGRLGSRRYSRSPIRRRSNSRSPRRRRLRSPYRKRASPIRRRSRSPFYNKHSRSPFRRRSRSPIRRRSRSPIRGRRSRSPFRRRSKSPVRRRSRSPFRKLSRSPFRRQSRSPIRRQSRSPVRRQSRSPVRRQSRSPVRRQSRSPVRRRSKSPLYRHPVSQSGEYSYNTERRYIRSPIKERSPGLRISRSPLREASISPIRKYGVHRYSISPDIKHLSTSNSRFDSRSNSPVLKHYKDNISSTSKGKYSPKQRGLDQNADLDPISDEDESIYFNTNERPQHLDEIMKISEPMRSLILQIIKKFSLTNANPRDPAFLELLKYVNTHSEAAEQLISQPSQNFDAQKQNMNPTLALQNALLQQQALDFRGNFPQSMYPQMATYTGMSGQSTIPFLTPSPMFSQGIQLQSQVSPALTHFQQNPSLASNLQQQRPLAHPYNLLQQLQQRPSGKDFTAFKDLKATVNKLFGASAPASTSQSTSAPLQPRTTTAQSFISQVANYGNKGNFKKIDFIDLIKEPPISLEVPPSDAKVTFCEQPRIMQKRNIFPVIGGASTSGQPVSVEVAKKTLAQRLASVLVKAGMIDVSAPLLQEMLMKIGAFSPRPPQDIKESEILDILKKLRYLS